MVSDVGVSHAQIHLPTCEGGGSKGRRPAVRLSATPPSITRPAPIVGHHSEEILHEFGVDEKTIADLEARKIIEQGRA